MRIGIIMGKNYERGIHAMPVEVLVGIADLFNTSLDYLAGRNAEKGH